MTSRLVIPLLLLAACGCLAEEEALMIGETVITASPIDEEETAQKTSESRITAADLLARGSISLPDALQREPGVSVPFDTAGVDSLVPYLQGGSKSINIRGLEGNRISVLLDGIRQPEDFTSRSFQGAGGPGRVYFDPGVLSGITLYKSATAGSDALGGAVVGETVSPSSLLGPSLDGRILKSQTSFASSNQSWNQRLAGAWGNGDIATSAVYLIRRGHEQENNGSAPANPADTESQALVWKAVLRGDEWTWEPTLDLFKSQGFVDLNSIEVDSLIGETLEASNDSETTRERLSLDFRYEPSAPPILFDELSGKIYYQKSRSQNLNIQRVLTPVGSLRNRTNELFYQTDIAGLNLKASKEIGDHFFTLSFQGSRSDITSSLLRTDEPSATDNLPNLAPSIVWRNGLNLSDEFKIGKWSINPSLRIEDYRIDPENTADFLEQTKLPIFDEFGRLSGERTVEAVEYENFIISPSLIVNYQATDRVELYGSYARGFRNPTAEELAGVFVHPNNVSITLPNPDLEEENSHSFELGARYETDFLKVDILTYYNRYGNFLESNVPTGEVLDGLAVQRTENARDAEIYGMELKFDWELGEQYDRFSGLSLGGSFAYSRGTSEDEPLNSVEPWKTVGYLAYENPEATWGFELSGTYLDGKDASQISGDLAPTDSYFLVDLIGYYHINDQVTLRAGLKNLLDEEYVLWSRANRGGGHDGGSSSLDTQPGLNAFIALELEW